METEVIDKFFLELSQFTKALTLKETKLLRKKNDMEALLLHIDQVLASHIELPDFERQELREKIDKLLNINGWEQK